jgi:pre-mRNA-splicing factor SPF27
MRHELERIKNQKPMEVLNMKRYELPPPPPNRLNDLNAWTDAVNNSQAQLEHQANRIVNLKLMNIYGAEAWKSYNGVLELNLQKAQKELAQLRKQIQEINYGRKRAQTDAGQKLGHLETNWVGLVSKNYEIEQACVQLEQEISMLENHSKQARRLSLPGDNEDGTDEPQSKRLRTESNEAIQLTEEETIESESETLETPEVAPLAELIIPEIVSDQAEST